MYSISLRFETSRLNQRKHSFVDASFHISLAHFIPSVSVCTNNNSTWVEAVHFKLEIRVLSRWFDMSIVVVVSFFFNFSPRLFFFLFVVVAVAVAVVLFFLRCYSILMRTAQNKMLNEWSEEHERKRKKAAATTTITIKRRRKMPTHTLVARLAYQSGE